MSAVQQEQEYEWCVDEAAAGMRVDKYVSERGEWSRTRVQRWIAEGRLSVDGRSVKANYRLRNGESVRLRMSTLAKEPEVKPEAIPLDIVYEDSDVVVVNKPRGMVVHPSFGHHSGTLVNALLAHCGDLSGINGVLRPGIVHRLDKDTSGLIVIAKHDTAHESLAAQFAMRFVRRTYVAIVHGNLKHEQGTIDMPIGRHPIQRQEMTVLPKHGKRAITHFTVLEKWLNYTLVKCRLETGRTHQIRVHLAHIGHPIVGDPKYGRKKTCFSIQGQALHAQHLGFRHPCTDDMMQFRSELPEDMRQILAELRLEKKC